MTTADLFATTTGAGGVICGPDFEIFKPEKHYDFSAAVRPPLHSFVWFAGAQIEFYSGERGLWLGVPIPFDSERGFN